MNKFATETLTVPINKIHPNPWNPRKQDDFTYRKLVDSIKKHGYIGSAVVRSKGKDEYEIINGEHRWQGCKELGYTEMKIESLGDIDDNTAKLLTITLNNLEGEDDPIERGRILSGLKTDAPELLELLPFSLDQIESEIKLIDFNPENDYKSDEEGAKDGAFKHTLTIEFKTEQDKNYAEKLLMKVSDEPADALRQVCKYYEDNNDFPLLDDGEEE